MSLAAYIAISRLFLTVDYHLRVCETVDSFDQLTPYSPAVQNSRSLYSLSCCSVHPTPLFPATDSYNSANYTGCHTLIPLPSFLLLRHRQLTPGTTPRSLRSLYSLSRCSVLKSSSPSPILCRCATVDYRRHIKKLSVAVYDPTSEQ